MKRAVLAALTGMIVFAQSQPVLQVRIWGERSSESLISAWATGFHKHHPAIRIEPLLNGDAPAIGGLYTGAADLALLGRRIWPTEIDAFEQVFGRKPESISVATEQFALAVYVHPRNPLVKLTLPQLDAIFGADHRRSPRNLRTWGDLGLAGDWARQPIRLYGFRDDVRDYAFSFSESVMGGSRKWNSTLQEFSSGREILDALSHDVYGLALAGLTDASPVMKPLALAAKSSGPFIIPTQQTLLSRQYPLSRTASLYFTRPPSEATRAFIEFVQSAEGQAVVLRDGTFLPFQSDTPDFLAELKPYHPDQQVSGTIRNWGNSYLPELMKLWEEGFRKIQPGVQFSTTLKGTETAVAGLYGGIADAAFVGRELYPSELDAFRGHFGYAPLEIRISSGSFATQHKTFALMVFVHQDNPLHRLTMKQLADVFGNSKQPVRTWGQLGLGGVWAQRPVHAYGYNFDTGMARFFRKAVFHDSGLWNEALKDFNNGRDPTGEVINAGVYVLDALAKDPEGIAYATVLYANPNVRTVALAGAGGGPAVEPTKENVWNRSYPLTRYTDLVLNRKPGQPIAPAIREWVRYILSRDGMEAVVREGSYVPLNPGFLREQLRKLEE